MPPLLSFVRRGADQLLCLDDRGQTAAEYALIVTLVAVVIAAAVALLGNDVHLLYNLAVRCAGAPNAVNCP